MEKQEFEFFWSNGSPFSNWFSSPFVLRHPDSKEEVKYTCVEQRMMHYKACMFKDYKIADKIMEAIDPRAHKSLGRKVAGYSDDQWSKVRYNVVLEAVKAKFSQNPGLKERLLACLPRRFVEASPKDTIWGIGMSASNPASKDPAKWRGLNLLGKALDETAGSLKK